MRVVCDWSTLMGQNTYILRFFHTFFSKGLWSAITGKHEVAAYVCDSEVISVICTHFSHRTVIIQSSPKDSEKAKIVAEFLSSGTLPVKFVASQNDHLHADVYISSSLASLLKFSGQRVFIGNVASSIIFWLFFNGEKICKNKQLYGLLTLFFSLWKVMIYLLLACVHLAFIRVSNQHMILVKHFVASIPFCMFFQTLRELLHVGEQWNIYSQGFVPNISWGYVNSSNSMLVGLFYLLVTLGFCTYWSIVNPVPAALAMITGLFYFSFFRCKWYIRCAAALASSATVWATFEYVL